MREPLNMLSAPEIVCAQIGAREHYAMPRAVQRLGRLQALVTDVWAPEWMADLRLGAKAWRRLSTRRHSEVPDGKVVSFNVLSVAAWALEKARLRGVDTERIYREYMRTGERFGLLLRDWLAAQCRRGSAPGALLTYSTGALEAIGFLREAGIPTMLGQIDPGRLIDDVFREEQERWPGWMPRQVPIPSDYFERLQREWDLSSKVVVNSEWSRTALVGQGVPRDKICVIPVAYEPPVPGPVARVGDGTFTVLWLGQVNLLKGFQYLVQCAELLRRERVRFVVVGQIAISDAAIAAAPPSMEFVGPIPRDEVTRYYRAADLFVFPTLCDGFGVTQLEAMAHGLPVVATRNCGEVVSDGVDGVIVPPRDPAALAEAITSLAEDRARLASMATAAVAKSRSFSIWSLGKRLTEVIDGLV